MSMIEDQMEMTIPATGENFLPARIHFTATKISLVGQIFTVVISVWSHANWAMVPNNLTAVIEVTLIDFTFVAGFLHTSQ